MKAAENTYRIPEKLWKSFGIIGREVYNKTMDSSVKNQGNLIPLKQEPISSKSWETICHNISCNAAWAANESL